MSAFDYPSNVKVLDDRGIVSTPWNQLFTRWQLLISAIPQSGPTASRPTSGLWIGRQFWDTTLGRPVYVKSVLPTVWADVSGSATPAGSTTQVQYNNAGAFGASSNFTYDSATNTLTLGSITGSALAMTIQPRAPTMLEDAGTLAITTRAAAKANSGGGLLKINTGAGLGNGQGGALWAQTGSSGTDFSGDIFFSTYNPTTPTKSGSIVLRTDQAPTNYSDGSVRLACNYGSMAIASFGFEFFLAQDDFGAGIPGLFKAGDNNLAGSAPGGLTFTAGNDTTFTLPGGDITFVPGNGSASGNLVFQDGSNREVIKIGNVGGNRAISFYGVALLARPTTASASSTRAAVIGTVANVGDTYDGYTLAQVVKALRNLGLLT